MNKAILIGRLTKDPELRYTQSNTPVANFTIAVNRAYTNQNGEREADFINCVTWEKQAENLKKYCDKGSQVAVEGRIQTRTYDDKNGKKVYVTEVIAENIQFLDRKKDGQASNEVKEEEKEEDPFADFGSNNTLYADEIEISDEDLPF
jgi:single-strand DNA-binding protein